MQPLTPRPPSDPDRLSFLSRVALVTVVTAAVVVAVTWAGTFSGPYRWLVEWQLAKSGSYSPELTWALLAVLLAFAVILALLALTRLDVLRTVSGKPIPWDAWRGRLRGATRWGKERKIRIALLGAGLFLAGAGLSECLRSQTAGPLTDIEAERVSPEAKLPSRWLRVRGRALTEFGITYETEGHKSDAETYIPLVPLEWKPSQPVTLFLRRTGSSRVAGDADRSFSGVLAFGRLPGMIRHEFQNRGLMPSDQGLVLDWGARPDDLLFGGVLQTLMGTLVALGAGLFWLVANLRASRGAVPKKGLTQPSN